MKRTKVLVVDDETIVRESLCGWLSDLGYQLFSAENGPKALEIIKKEHPGIAITGLGYHWLRKTFTLPRRKTCSRKLKRGRK
ncbi:MAG: hypothetical protein SU899_05075 [Chloroflexota bacterium]|nr:hypothetical protein [Chloroflexota bacterium]